LQRSVRNTRLLGWKSHTARLEISMRSFPTTLPSTSSFPRISTLSPPTHSRRGGTGRYRVLVETIEQGRIVKVADGLATIAIGQKQLVALAPPADNGGIETEVYVCIHAEDVTLETGADLPQTSARNQLVGRIRSLDREGPIVRVNLDCGFPLKALITNQACQNMALQEQGEVVALIKATAIHVITRGL
jgi:molybdopterin-binding protein